jgi:hypothetical protein
MPEAQSSTDYLQVANDRIDDAGALLREGGRRYSGAFYLCGYGVECSLKALLLERSTTAQRPKLLKSFRGKIGHSLEEIKKRLRGRGVTIPQQLTRAFASVNTWSVNLRYDTGSKTRHETAALLRSVKAVAAWVEREL